MLSELEGLTHNSRCAVWDLRTI